MSQLAQRRVRVVIAAPAPVGDYGKNMFAGEVLEIEDLRVQFKATKTHTKEPNTAEITITNLSEVSRGRLEKNGKILVQAGYLETVETIFVGDIRSVDHRHVGTDWESVVRAGDGERGLRYGRVNASMREGVKIPAIVDAAVQKMGYGKLTDIQAASLKGEYTQGYSMYGPARKELDRILKDQGYEWSVQDNAIHIALPGGATSETVVLLTPQTGLIGSPEMGSPEVKGGKPMLKFRSLLQPTIRIGRRVKVKTAHIDGVFVPRKVTHTGDTAGGDWYTDVEAVVV